MRLPPAIFYGSGDNARPQLNPALKALAGHKPHTKQDFKIGTHAIKRRISTTVCAASRDAALLTNTCPRLRHRSSIGSFSQRQRLRNLSQHHDNFVHRCCKRRWMDWFSRLHVFFERRSSRRCKPTFFFLRPQKFNFDVASNTKSEGARTYASLAISTFIGNHSELFHSIPLRLRTNAFSLLVIFLFRVR